MTYQDAESLLRNLETKLESVQSADPEDEDGDRDSRVADLSDGIAAIKDCLESRPQPSPPPPLPRGKGVDIDFSAPSADMIQQMKDKSGLDLTDKRYHTLAYQRWRPADTLNTPLLTLAVLGHIESSSNIYFNTIRTLPRTST